MMLEIEDLMDFYGKGIRQFFSRLDARIFGAAFDTTDEFDV